MTVALNGKVAGQSAAQTYFLFEVDPGAHEVSSISENTSTVKLVLLRLAGSQDGHVDGAFPTARG